MTFFALDDVSVTFGGVIAVRDVSLSLERGEIRGLIGPNGAGKTSLINAVTGMVPISANVDRFFRLANQAVIAEDTGGRVHDLSKVFADLSGEYFLDFCHLNEAGNEMVAEAMLPSVVSALRELDAGSNPRAPLDSQRFRPASTNVTH